MTPCKIYKDDIDVPSALAKFSVLIDDLKEVVKNTLTERLHCVDIDVLNASERR